MKYMGSKDRISEEIKNFIILNKTKNQTYVEPFCGGCNMIDKIKGKRIANDNNKYLIALWKGLQLNLERPNPISKEVYTKAKNDFKNNTNLHYSDFLIGWIGFMGTFNGRFFDGGGYSKITTTKENIVRDYVKEQIKNTEAQTKLLKDVVFSCLDYSEITIPDKSIIYCDPPYIDTSGYTKSEGFNYLDFYDWAELKSKEGHTVFVSEYFMPNERFEKIWSKNIESKLSTKTQLKTESLFIPKGQKILKQISMF